MDYLKINYYKLQHLKIKKYNLLIFLIIGLIIFSFIYINQKEIPKRIESYGVYDGLVLKIIADKSLSEAITKNNSLTFKGKKVNYEIAEFGEYEMLNNTLYQEIDLIIDKDYNPNETGEVIVYFDQVKIRTFILELFK